jgi:hypothetical protein
MVPEPTKAEVEAEAKKAICDPLAPRQDREARRPRPRDRVLRKTDVKKAERAAAGPKETKIGKALEEALAAGVTTAEIHEMTGCPRSAASSPRRSAPSSR